MVSKKVARRAGKPRGAPPPEEMFGLPTRLQRAINRRGFTQEKIETLSGVSQGTISTLTREPLSEAVTAAVVARLAKALNVSLNFLLMGVGDELPEMRSTPRAELPLPARGAERSLDESSIPEMYSAAQGLGSESQPDRNTRR